jgi:CubicO group peptidase (beta-lactamase class C family)
VGLEVEVEPGQVGFDAPRLRRIDRHFARYVEDGRLRGWLVLVSRRGRIVHLAACGRRDLEADLPVELDTRFRVYSMTKPVTAVAAMQLYEEGAFVLKDPVAAFIPSFAELSVYRDDSASGPPSAPATRPVLLWHLLTHTAGLTYGFHHAHPVDAMYRAAGFELAPPEGRDLAECCDLWAGLPLLFEPGSGWNYSVASDVLGRVVEVISGLSLDRFFAERIFAPLGMGDTGFWVEGEAAGKLAALYAAGPQGRPVRSAAGRFAGRPAWRAGRGWSRPRPTTIASPRPCCAGASWTVPGCSAAAPLPTWPATTCPAGPTSSRSGGGCSPRPPSTGSATALGLRSCSTRLPTRFCPAPASSPGAARPAPSSGSTRPSSSPPSS